MLRFVDHHGQSYVYIDDQLVGVVTQSGLRLYAEHQWMESTFSLEELEEIDKKTAEKKEEMKM